MVKGKFSTWVEYAEYEMASLEAQAKEFPDEAPALRILWAGWAKTRAKLIAEGQTHAATAFQI